METTSSSGGMSTQMGAGSKSSSNIPADGSMANMDGAEEDSKFKERQQSQVYVIDTEMLLIEDSTLDKIPPHLENLLGSFDVNESIPADNLLMVLIYGIALECSFAAIDEVQKKLQHLQQMSCASTFNIQNVMLLSKMPENIYDVNKMIYTMRIQLIFDEAATPCLFTGIVTGDFLILTLTPGCGDAIGKSICLSIARYVLNAKGRPFPSRFRKLPELSYKLREHVLIPIHNHMIKKSCSILLYPGLDGLPEEVYPYVYFYMNKNGLNKMANVSKRFQVTVDYYKKYMMKKFNQKLESN